MNKRVGFISDTAVAICNVYAHDVMDQVIDQVCADSGWRLVNQKKKKKTKALVRYGCQSSCLHYVHSVVLFTSL